MTGRWEQGVKNRKEERKVRGEGDLWERLEKEVSAQLLIGSWHLVQSVEVCVCVCLCVLGAVSLAGAQNNLWAVEGGNKLVCSGLLKMANANLLQAKVNSISPVYSGTLP